MSTLAFRVTSNIAVHGHKFAFDHEYARAKRAGYTDKTAFYVAASRVFKRVVY
jgi:hypothetical protein